MEWVIGVIVLYVLYQLVTAPARKQQAIEEARADEFDEIWQQIEQVTTDHWSPPRDDNNPFFISFELELATMTYEHSSTYVDDGPIPLRKRYQLFRDGKGGWWERLADVTKGGDDVDIIDHLAAHYSIPGEAAESDEDLALLELETAKALGTEWTAVGPALVPWLESAYGRCIRYFAEHRGLYPGLTAQAYRQQQYDPSRVWAPPVHATPIQLESSRGRAAAAIQRLRKAYADRGIEAWRRCRLDEIVI